MHAVIQAYLEAPFRYVFKQNPDIATDFRSAIDRGINCISLSHLVLFDLFGARLPSSFRSSEQFLDTHYFETVDTIDTAQLGDLVWFGLADPPVTLEQFSPRYQENTLLNWRDFPVKHVAIFSDRLDQEFYLLHATAITGTTSLWTLAEFGKFTRYQKIYGIRRLKAQYRQDAGLAT